MVYVFGEFELDLSTYGLVRDGQRVALQRKPFDVLCTLIERRDSVVTREEILQACWPDEHVEDWALTWSIRQARKALGKGHIQTVRGRGYRFVTPVETRASGGEQTAAEPAPSTAVPAVTGGVTGVAAASLCPSSGARVPSLL